MASNNKNRFTDPNVRMCPSQIACEGSYLQPGKDVCRSCERAQKGRYRIIAPRGEHYMTYTESRKRT